MALFNVDFDFAKRRAEREAAEKAAKARAGFRSALDAGRSLPTAPSPFLGVSPDLTDADLEALVRNEEAARVADQARGAHESQLFDAMAMLKEAGIDPEPIMRARDLELRRGAIEDLRGSGEFGPHEYVNALNKLDVSPYRFNTVGAGNRFTGGQRLNPAGEALAGQRDAAAVASEAAAGNYDALADYNAARGDSERFRNQAIEDILEAPTNPLLAADIVNRKTTYKPQRVKVRRKDGTTQEMDAIPNQAGGWDYMPATTSAGEPVISAADAGDDTALQKDTAFIAQTLGIPANEALLFKMRSRAKAPEDSWAELIGRLVSADRYAKPEKIEEKARAIWAVMRPGELVPTSASTSTGAAPAAGATPGSPASDEQAKAVRRAEAEGYSNFGNWVPGRGLEIFDDQGNLVGHYY